MRRLAFRRPGQSLAAFVLWLLPTLIGLMLTLADPPAVERFRDLIFDEYQALSPRVWSPDAPVRVVDIDDESLSRYGQWPWPRTRLAELTRKLTEAGAAAIAFDIVFAEPDRSSPERILEQMPDLPETRALAARLKGEPDHDAALAAAIGAGPAALAFVLTHGGAHARPPQKTGFAFAGDDPRLFVETFDSTILPLPILAERAPGLGAINFLPDRDLVVRRVPLVFALRKPGGSVSEATLLPSLDAEALRLAQGASTILVKSSNASGQTGFSAQTGVVAVRIGATEIAVDKDASVRIRYAGTQAGRRIPAWKALTGEARSEEIAGKIMLVGASAAALSDLRSTPLEGAAPGIDIHAEAIEHITSGASLSRPDYAPGLEAFALVALCVAAGLVARYLKAGPAAFAMAGLVAAAFGASFWAFLRRDALFDALMPAATAVAAYLIVTLTVYRRAERERRSVRAAFSRYLAPAMVERIAADPSHLVLGGETRVVTVLFADARDFTARSETLDARGVVEFLNRMLTPLTRAVLSERGTIDKYLGDGLMAFWNAPLDVPDHASRACRAALAMQALTPQIDAAQRAAAGGAAHLPVRVGIGLNTGDAFVGNMGSEQRFDYSIVGDAVNVAARLESASKEFGAPIVVSRATREAASGFRFVDLGPIDLKGKAEATRAFALHGPDGGDEKDFAAFLALHERILAAVQSGKAPPPDLVAAALACADGRPYATFYARLGRLTRDA